MACEDLGEAAELNAYHCDIRPRFCAALGRFIISNQAAVTHEPRERALHHPAPRQDFKSFGRIRTLDDLHFEFSAQGSNPIGEGGPVVTAIYPEQAQQVNTVRVRISKVCAPSRSGVLAGVTTMPSRRPSASTRMCRLRPLILLAAS